MEPTSTLTPRERQVEPLGGPAPTPRRWPWLVAPALLLLVGAGAATFLLFLRDDDRLVHGPESSPFTVTAPRGWEPVPEGELSGMPGSPLVVLRQSGGEGIVAIGEERGVSRNLTRLSRALRAELRERFPDFKLVRTRRIAVEAGPALSLSYARTRKGTAHTLLVVPAGDRSYTLNAVVPAGHDEAAAAVGEILASFDVEGSK